ncbi:hypothetical protein [Mammaliicoccus stepanovicii]|uniref:Uncharacterized protein n=1 Tax=Mammaliicoccus stepanovicii TaxID=643214 RepID=A0A239YTI0_9STAP|nr:hypothetical protein [Mammaliicoccus stepanovicii]PNZ75883.1 hypothetical protein CD111_05980 [Mammaliicoccus stepanovicii]GGI42363.1 hypothetical protein GCM10010896_18050 [Mammaliicoccus stepanovicii]SNV61676.1 Uncharacterised protein [Mammaliicoccus stepanovicii]
MTKRAMLIVCIVAVVIVILVTVVPFKQAPSSTTRVVVDHYNKKYAFPNCYKYNEASNYLDEVTLQDAEELNYPPMNKCTEDEIKPKYKSLIQRLIESTEI